MYRNSIKTALCKNIESENSLIIKKFNIRIVNFFIVAFALYLNSCNIKPQEFHMKNVEELKKEQKIAERGGLGIIEELVLNKENCTNCFIPKYPISSTNQKTIADSSWNLVSELNQFPKSCTGLLKFTHNDKPYIGTATLIAPRIALAAAHNLVDIVHNIDEKRNKKDKKCDKIYWEDSKKESMTFSPAMNGDETSKIVIKVADFKYDEGCKKDLTNELMQDLIDLKEKPSYYNRPYDYGIIFLYENTEEIMYKGVKTKIPIEELISSFGYLGISLLTPEYMK